MRVATAFVALQDDRHRADCDTTATFARSDAESAVARARAAFADLDAVAATPPWRLFALLLLTGEGVIQGR